MAGRQISLEYAVWPRTFFFPISGFRLILRRLVASSYAILNPPSFFTPHHLTYHVALHPLLNLFSRSMKAACFHSAFNEV